MPRGSSPFLNPQLSLCGSPELISSYLFQLWPIFIMRIAILYNRDLYSNEALNRLLPALGAHELKLFFSGRVGHKAPQDPRLVNLAFVEQGLFNDYLFPLIERLDSQGSRLTFNQLAARFSGGSPALIDTHSAADRALLGAFRPDLIVSIRFGQILGREVLDLAALGTLNLHSGLLPQYRGVMATFWSLLHDAGQLGTTVHWIDSEAIDAGPVLATTRQSTDREKSYFQQTLSLYRDGVAALLSVIDTLAEGAVPQPIASEGSAAYFSFPTAQQLDEFEDRCGALFTPEGVQDVMATFFPKPSGVDIS